MQPPTEATAVAGFAPPRVQVGTAAPFLVLLGGLALLAWFSLAWWGRSPHARFLSHHGLAGDANAVFALLFLLAWTIMVVAMMLPTSLPLVALFGAIVRQRADRTRLMALLLVGYVATWVGFGVVLLAGDAILHAMLASLQWLASGAGLLAAGVLVLAGAYQFTSLKRHCLTQCRSPRSFILGHWRGNASGDALRLGVRHGLYCLGCCWTLMLVMFAVGLGSLAWMVALGAVMGAEKNLAWGRRLSAPLGVVLLGAGAWVGAVELGLTSGVV